jgi:hypothetical protein
MSYKFALSQAGYDYDDTDPRNLIISSAYNTFKFSAQAATSVTINNGSASGSRTIAHGLGYTPSVLAWFELDTGKVFLAGTPVISGLSTYGGFLYVDDTNLVLFCNRSGTSGTVAIDVYYYIMYEVGA